MANASVWTEGVAEEIQGESNEDSSEETEDTGSCSEENAKQNGSVGSSPNRVTTDRFGFIGGNQFTSRENEVTVPIDVMRKREVKWLDMLENWEKWMSKRFKKVKERCRKGVPPAIRPRAWQFLCGSKFLMEQNKGRFEEYIQVPGEPRWVEDIRKDLHRQFPFHEMFMAKGGHGQEDLFNVLKAYTVHNPTDGYCQAQAPIAAVLLMHMPAEQAFWCLVSVCEKYLPGYYSPGLEAVQTDGDVLFGLLKRCYPATYKHLKKHRVEPILYMTEWFMCVFSRTLPWSSVLRIWDMFFCEGVKVMFRVALVLVKSTVGRPEQIAQCPGLYETLERVRKIPVDYMREDYLTNECLRLPITERDMEKEHQHQLARRRAQKDKVNNPGKTKKKSKQPATSSPPQPPPS